MSKSFAILGLGRFGCRLTEALHDIGAEILVADNDEEKINRYSDIADTAIVADLANEESVRALGIEEMDVAVICMGESLESSIICAMVAGELGVPKVLAKASNKRMGDILTKIGVNEIIYPEEEAAFRTAKRLMSENFIDYYDLDENLCLISMSPKEEWIGHSLSELNLRGKYSINVIAVKENGGKFTQPDPKRSIGKSAQMMVVAEKKNLKKLN